MASREKKRSGKRDDSGKSEMLDRVRARPFLYIGTIVILVIIVIAFVFVPILSPRGGFGGELVFGYYNRAPIAFVPDNFFHQQYERMVRMYQPSTDSPSYLSDMAWIWREAFEATVIHMGVLDEMRIAGYVAPDSVVDREVARLPMFQENGRFSSARYRAMDSNTRMNIWRRVQESIAFDMYVSDLLSLKVPSPEGTFVSNMASPLRTFDVAIFPSVNFPESEISAFMQANPEIFTVTHLSRITITSGEREARQILESVRSGFSTFEEAAVNHSQDWAADRGGDMGSLMVHHLQYELVDEEARRILMNLSRGELSDLIRVPTGWAFFRAEENPAPADLDNPSHRSTVRSYILTNERGRIEDWLISEAERFIIATNQRGFDNALSEFGMFKQTLGPLPVNYGDSLLFSSVSNAGIPELANSGSDMFFWRAAFGTPLLTPSRPLVIGNDVIVLFPTEEVEAGEDDRRSIESYLSFRAMDSTSHGYQAYFMNNRKLDDRFEETFWNLWW
ncbi:MAG: SurA N-terminal domain-containing protein [Treponema sp.]|nr:SurA N-terminal domain-containing protein [Treponema sp.]